MLFVIPPPTFIFMLTQVTTADPKKYSAHVIFPNIQFKNHEEQQLYLNFLQHWVSDETIKKIWDTAVYSKFQIFRTLGAAKLDVDTKTLKANTALVPCGRWEKWVMEEEEEKREDQNLKFSGGGEEELLNYGGKKLNTPGYPDPVLRRLDPYVSFAGYVNPLYKMLPEADCTPADLIDKNPLLKQKLIELAEKRKGRRSFGLRGSQNSRSQSHGGISVVGSDDIALFCPDFEKVDEEVSVDLHTEAAAAQSSQDLDQTVQTEEGNVRIASKAEMGMQQKTKKENADNDDHEDFRKPLDVLDVAMAKVVKANGATHGATLPKPMSPTSLDPIDLRPFQFETVAERFSAGLNWLHPKRIDQFWSW